MCSTRRFLVKTIGVLAASFSLGACRDDRADGIVDPHVVARETIAHDALPAVAVVTMSTRGVRYGAAGARRKDGPHNLQVSIFDRFAIGSMTKSMTATLAGILVEQGFIRWESRLYEVLPELERTGLADYAEVALADGCL